MARRSLTSFERRCLLSEVLQRRKLRMPRATAVVTERDQRVYVKVTGNWHPNPVELWGASLDEVRNLGPELFYQRNLLNPDESPYRYQLQSPEYTDEELEALVRYWDGQQREDGTREYLKSLEKRRKFVEEIGK